MFSLLLKEFILNFISHDVAHFMYCQDILSWQLELLMAVFADWLFDKGLCRYFAIFFVSCMSFIFKIVSELIEWFFPINVLMGPIHLSLFCYEFSTLFKM